MRHERYSSDLRRPRRPGPRGVALLLTLVVTSALLLSGFVALELRMSTLRQAGEALRGKEAFYCAEAGLAAGRDHFRAHAKQWTAYLHNNFQLTGQASQEVGVRFNYAVRILDNVDEFPPFANDPQTDSDQVVLMESTCLDGTLNTPITLRQYLSLIPTIGVAHGHINGPTVYDHTYPQVSGGPSFTGGDAVDSNGELPTASGSYNNGGVMSVGLDLRNDRIQLSSRRTTFPFIWLSNSGDGTISKLNTETGVELGRYYTGPGYGNPSRLAVDLNGDVWVANRGNNTLTKIGLKEAGNCVDRDGDGTINTSSGGADVKDWTGAFGGGIAGAVDECILQHVAVSYAGVETPWDLRLVAVDKDNYIYTGGISGRGLYKLRSADGAIVAARNTNGSHYGGFVDKNGALWVTSDNAGWVQRISTDLTSVIKIPILVQGYGIAMDPDGKLWSSEWSGGRIQRMNPDGSGQVTFNQTVGSAQGLAIAQNGDVFVTGSMFNPIVDHFDKNGHLIETLTVGGGCTGLSFDAAGKLWSSNYTTGTASRIDLTTKQVDTFPVGNGPYNYSDMTGFILRNVTTRQGTWSVRLDGGGGVHYWQSVSWVVQTQPAGTTIVAKARSAPNLVALASAPWRALTSGQSIPSTASGLPGRIIEVQITLSTTTDGQSPVLSSVTLTPW